MVRWSNAISRLNTFWRALPAGVIFALQSLIVLASVLSVGLPQVQSSFDASRRYADIVESDLESTNNALDSAKCARKTGIWLLRSCENGQIVPFGMEDPGQSLFLSIWARLAGRDATVMDAARLNLAINTVGLTILIVTLMSFRAFPTSVVLLVFGPFVFLEWFGTSHHWALMGAVSMLVVLPLALVARARDWLRPAAWGALLVVGLLSLAFAALLREAVASMAVLVTICAAAWTMRHGPRQTGRLAGTLAIVVLAVLASQSSRGIVAVRDWAYSTADAQLPATHGMSHTLYTGLGAVENKFGIRYLDAVGRDAAEAAAPGVVYGSSDYFRVMRDLYIRKWREDPGEVIRIYFEKLKILLTDRILASAPPLGLFLILIGAIQLAASYRRGIEDDPNADRRIAINLVVLGFVGLFIVQGVLASPTRLYSLPLGPLILVLGGIAIENLVAGLWWMATCRTTRPS